MRRYHLQAVLPLALVALATSQAAAAIPYTPVPTSGLLPTVGPGVHPPDAVYGKEYSHDFDFSTVGPVPRSAAGDRLGRRRRDGRHGRLHRHAADLGT